MPLTDFALWLTVERAAAAGSLCGEWLARLRRPALEERAVRYKMTLRGILSPGR